MTDRKTVKINLENYEKLMDIKELKGYRSLNETLENLLPVGSVQDVDYQHEPPAFEITDNTVSWNTLKESDVNTTWKSKDKTESAVVIFKDEFGALIRFMIDDEFNVNYFHFLK